MTVKDEPIGATSARIVKKSADPEQTDGNDCYSLSGAVFGVYSNQSDASKGKVPMFTVTSDENGIAYISDIAAGTYYVKELEAPKGFSLSEEIAKMVVNVEADSVAEITITDTPLDDPVELLLTKVNATTGAEDITADMSGAQYEFKFYNGYYLTEDELSGATPERSWIFETLYDNQENKYKILYDNNYLVSGDQLFESGRFPLGTVTIKEVKAPNGDIPYYLDDTLYIVPIYADDQNTVHSYNIPVSNEYQIELTDIEVSKVWDDDNDRDGVRPDSLRYVLSNNNGDIIQTVDVSEDNNYFYRFTNLPTETENHTPITYSVAEVITNEYARSKYTSSVSIPLELVTQGDVTKGINSVYKTEFTNKHTPEYLSFSGTKKWNDFDNKYGYRPESVEVTLYRNGEAIATAEMSNASGWTYSFPQQLRYHDSGIAYDYKVAESNVNYYNSESNVTKVNSTIITDFTNTLKNGSVILNKIDENGNPMTDENTVLFALYTEDGTPVEAEAVGDELSFSGTGDSNKYYVNSQGYIRIKNLPVGNYYFVELETKEGYMPLDEKLSFTIEPNEEEAITVNAKNNLLIIPNTGGIGNSIIYIGAITVALIAVAFAAAYFIKKNKEEKTK